jgi:hypothetical protein
MRPRRSWFAYVLLFVVLASSAIAVLSPRTGSTAQALLVLPGVAALIALVGQVVREELAFDRALALQQQEQSFALGAMSPMAALTFERQAAFAEAYITTAITGLHELWNDPIGERASQLSTALGNLRVSFAAWVPPDAEGHLAAIESVLADIGARGRTLSVLPRGDLRTKVVQELFDNLAKVYPGKPDANPEERKLALERLPAYFRELLGTAELSRLRRFALAVAEKQFPRLEVPDAR